MDINKLNDSMHVIDDDVMYIDSMLQDIVEAYSKYLDDIMLNISKDVLTIESPALVTIEKYFLELSSALYFMCDKVERLGVFDSISKAKAQETYNNKYLEHQTSNIGVVGGKKPTVAESTAVAENESIYDKTVSDVYSRAYKIIKTKISAAETMISTLSKILSHRIQEANLTTAQTTRQILNEGDIYNV